MSYINKETKIISKLESRLKQNKIYIIVIIILFVLSLAANIYLVVSYEVFSKPSLALQNKNINNLKSKIDILKNQNDSLLEASYNQKNKDELAPPLIYMVQIGAFKKYKIPFYSNDLSSLKKYEDIPFVKYSLGIYYKYEQAKNLKLVLRRFGFYDVFVVAMYKGKKINIKEALKYENNLENGN